jgi:hypothetical protein
MAPKKKKKAASTQIGRKRKREPAENDEKADAADVTRSRSRSSSPDELRKAWLQAQATLDRKTTELQDKTRLALQPLLERTLETQKLYGAALDLEHVRKMITIVESKPETLFVVDASCESKYPKLPFYALERSVSLTETVLATTSDCEDHCKAVALFNQHFKIPWGTPVIRKRCHARLTHESGMEFTWTFGDDKVTNIPPDYKTWTLDIDTMHKGHDMVPNLNGTDVTRKKKQDDDDDDDYEEWTDHGDDEWHKDFYIHDAVFAVKR